MQKLREIEESLKQLHIDFNEQVVTLSNDTKEFHNSLIDLVSKYPEHKELIQFIVFVNDKLETNQHMFGEVIVEAFNDLVDSKRALVREVIHTKTHLKEQERTCSSKLWNKLKTADVKIVVMGLVISIVSIGIMVDGAFVTKALSLMSGLFGS